MARSAKAEFILDAQDRTKIAFDKATARLESLSVSAKRGALAVAAVGTAMAAATVKAVNHADGIAKGAKAAGIASGAYQELMFTGSQLGIQQGAMTAVLQGLNRRIGETASGTGEARVVFEQLGISVRDASGKVRSSEAVLRDIATAMQGMETDAERAGAASKIFGEQGAAFGIALKDGPEVLDENARAARELGIVLDENLLRNAEAASDQLDRMKRIAGVQATSALANLFPLVIDVGNAFAAAAPHIRQFFDAMNPDSELSLFGEMAQLDAEITELERRINRVAGSSGDALTTTTGVKMTQFGPLRDSAAITRDIEIALGNDSDVARLEEAVEKRQAIQKKIDDLRAATRVNVDRAEPGDGGASVLAEAEERKTQTLIESQRRRFEALHIQALQAQGLEAEAEMARFDAEMARFEEQNQLIRESEHLTALEKANFQQEVREAEANAATVHAERLVAIDKKKASEQIKTEGALATAREQAASRGKMAAMGALTSLAQQSKAVQIAMLAFEKGKAIADVIVLTQVGAARAIAELGPILGPPAAAAIKAAGAVSVGLIAAQGIAEGGGGSGGGGSLGGSFGGGGGDFRPTPSLPNPAANVQQSDQNAANSTIRLVFDSSQDTGIVREIINGIRVQVDEGDATLFSSGSRQAMEIRGG